MMTTQMNRTQKIVGALMTVLSGVAVYCFFAFRYPYHLHFQEQYQLFEFTWGYFLNVAGVPGGLADWVGRFLTQFCYYAPAGAFVMALVFCALQWITWVACRQLRSAAGLLLRRERPGGQRMGPHPVSGCGRLVSGNKEGSSPPHPESGPCPRPVYGLRPARHRVCAGMYPGRVWAWRPHRGPGCRLAGHVGALPATGVAAGPIPARPPVSGHPLLPLSQYPARSALAVGPRSRRGRPRLLSQGPDLVGWLALAPFSPCGRRIPSRKSGCATISWSACRCGTAS